MSFNCGLSETLDHGDTFYYMVASFLGKIRSKVLNRTFNRVGRLTIVQSENLSKNHITKGALLKLEDKEYALLKFKHFLFFIFFFFICKK